MPLPNSGPMSLLQMRDEMGESQASLVLLSQAAGFSSPYHFSNFYGFSAGPGVTSYAPYYVVEGNFVRVSFKTITQDANSGIYYVNDPDNLEVPDLMEGIEEVGEHVFNFNFSAKFASRYTAYDLCTSPLIYDPWWGTTSGGTTSGHTIVISPGEDQYGFRDTAFALVPLTALVQGFDVREMMLSQALDYEGLPRDFNVLGAFPCSMLGSGYTSEPSDVWDVRVYRYPDNLFPNTLEMQQATNGSGIDDFSGTLTSDLVNLGGLTRSAGRWVELTVPSTGGVIRIATFNY